ncbi:MAG TPA: alpha/beta fold hydrolase [Stellaceae bacterium]|nr:alpha/beta fold hydrolase [Stellaceae bacterium]
MPERSRIAANGIAVSYRLEGPAGAPVIMLSNSFLTDYGMWDFQVPAFTAKYRVLRYDPRGHGDTQASPPPYSVDLLVADVVGLLDALGIGRVHFLGLSMGGVVGQLMASRHPDRLLSLLLSDTACHLPPEAAWDDRIALATTKGTGAFVQPMTTRWLTPAYYERHPEIVAKLGAMIAKTSVDGAIGCAQALQKMNQSSILRGIEVPTLIIVGAHDVGTPVSAAKFLHREIEGSTLAIVDEAGHLSNIEQAETFNRIVLDFLARLPS